ncbi:MAG: metal-sulfur cluster assembly factor, partial [Rhabdochlamydiaceae bacterium]
MPTKEELQEKLREVIDPEIGLNIVDLGMVRDVVIRGDTVLVKIALTVKGCPLANTIEKDINRILGKQTGVSRVVVTMESMSKEELNLLGTR